MRTIFRRACRGFFVLAFSFSLTACFGLGPPLNLGGEIPETCAAIDKEIATINDFVADVGTAKTAKTGAVILLGAAAAAGSGLGAAGIAGSALSAFSISLDAYHARIDELKAAKNLKMELGKCG